MKAGKAPLPTSVQDLRDLIHSRVREQTRCILAVPAPLPSMG